MLICTFFVVLAGISTSHPLAFFIRKITVTERRCSTFWRERLAAHSSVKHFRYHAEAGKIVVYTDPKPLIHALQSRSNKCSEREFRQYDGMKEDFQTWAKNCEVCQRAKVHQHNKTPIGYFSSADAHRPRSTFIWSGAYRSSTVRHSPLRQSLYPLGRSHPHP